MCQYNAEIASCFNMKEVQITWLQLSDLSKQIQSVVDQLENFEEIYGEQYQN